MDNLNVQIVASLIGRAKGISGNPALSRILNGRLFNQALGISGSTTSAGVAFNGYDGQRTLATTATETLDLTSFTNILGQPTQALTICRLFYVQHDSSSPASAIVVGDSGANGFKPLGALGTTGATMSRGVCMIFEIPTTAGQTVGATAKDLKVVNLATTQAIYNVGWWGV